MVLSNRVIRRTIPFLWERHKTLTPYIKWSQEGAIKLSGGEASSAVRCGQPHHARHSCACVVAVGTAHAGNEVFVDTLDVVTPVADDQLIGALICYQLAGRVCGFRESCHSLWDDRVRWWQCWNEVVRWFVFSWPNGVGKCSSGHDRKVHLLI